MNNETIVIMDFGGQYQHLIARRVREMGVYCEVLPYDAPIERIRALNPKGIIFTGGPSSVNEEGAPMCDAAVFSLGVPVLGICYGIQIMTVLLGGRVDKSEREYGSAELEIISPGALFEGVSGGRCWMSHTDAVITPPEGFRAIARTACCPTAAMENAERRLYGVQFHPEVEHTENGSRILANFLFKICGCKGDWTMDAFAQTSVEALSGELRGKRVLCALSGGVDSAVTATMLHKAVGDRLTCIFVDTGLMRKGEPEQVQGVFKPMLGEGYVHVDARKFFLDALAGVTDPEKKRKIIGEAFIRVFEREAAKLGGADVLAQGTIYPDVIESGAGKAAVIKSHHNVGGLPEKIGFTSIVEPLRRLFKDEVRAVGRELGLPEELVSRQPFPGPGLAVRVLGEVTEEKLAILREADAIFREEMKAAGCDKSAAQYFAVLTGLRSVGVQGDGRTYWYTVALRAVTTTDFMTADWARLPHEVLAKASNRIVNNIPGVNRVVYDITSKPPATIEWE